MDWFTVDKAGLAKLLEKKGKAFALFELIQNPWDTRATQVNVKIEPIPGRPYATVFVEDNDPDGFKNLSHAFTLFAESEKKSDPTKRGRFNLGEKLVLALCEKAEIISTTGSVYFTSEGRTLGRKKLEAGSCFLGTMRMTREEYADVVKAVNTLIPPMGVETLFNGEPLKARPILKEFTVKLPTESSDAEGILRKTARATKVTIHKVLEGETASIYEMGIPVVETGDTWHVNIFQKVPLNADRDNVTPAYLREVRTQVLNAMFEYVRGETATTPWVREATGDERANPDAIEQVMTERFGTKRVIYDPTDPEGTKLAVSQGYTVISGGALSAGEWKNVKATGAALPAGQVTPSPKPFHPDGEPLTMFPKDTMSVGMLEIIKFAADLGREVLGKTIKVEVADDPRWGFRASYGNSRLIINHPKVGGLFWVCGKQNPDVLRLLIHEFGHEYASDHLSKEYHDALCKVGARVALLACEKPELFKGV